MATEEEAKPPVRAVRSRVSVPSRRAISAAEADVLDENWSPVITGIIELNIEQVHRELEEGLRERDPATASALIEAINSAQSRRYMAAKLSARARREYELFKISHEAWWEAKKDGALLALSEAKKSGEIQSKQITNDMVRDRVIATWPDEVRERERRYRDFQAATHVLESLEDAWKRRADSLSDLRSLITSTGGASPLRDRIQHRE